MAALGQLVVSLTAETAQFRQAMDRASFQAQKNFQTITSAAKTAGGLLAGALAIGSFKSFIEEQINAADAVLKTSQKIGISVESLSRLNNAADLAGVSSNELSSAFVKLNKSISDASNGSKEQVEAFERIGISSKELKTLSPEEVFNRLSDSFAKSENGAAKTATAVALLGRSGADLIPLLNQGSEALQQYSTTFTDDFAKSAEAFNDNITELRQNFSRLAVTIAGPLVSAINQAFGTPTGKDLDAAIEKTQKLVDDLKDSIIQTQLFGGKGLFSNSEKEVAKFKIRLAEAEAELARLQSRKESANKTATQSIVLDNEESEKKNKVADILKKQVDAYNSLVMEKEQLVLIEAALAGATEEQLNQIQRVIQATKEYQQIQNDLRQTQEQAISLAQEWKTLYESTASPAQKLADGEARLLELRERLIKAGYEQKAVDNAIAEARMNLADSFAQTGEKAKEATKTVFQFGDAFKSAFENAILSGNDLRSVLQGLLQDIIKIAIRTAITEPLGKAIASAIPTFSFGGGKALGGPVIGGTSYLVGEKGPEIFTAPAGGGQIIPNSAMGDNVVVNQTFNISAGVSQTVRAEISNLMPRIMEATKAAVVDSRRRGGTFSKAFS